MSKASESICYLCGSAIESNPRDDRMKLSMDHVPPKQFFPKQLRTTENLNLQVAPSHKKCNEDYRQDEEYFYISMYPIVAKNNPWMGSVFMQDFARRSNKPQTPAMLRKIFSSASMTTQGGIHLPSGMVEIIPDKYRLHKVAAKIARGVLFISTERCFQDQQIVDMRFCLKESEVVEYYKIAWKHSSVSAIYTKVFSYKYFPYEGFHIISMLFWEAFMYNVTVQDAAEHKS